MPDLRSYIVKLRPMFPGQPHQKNLLATDLQSVADIKAICNRLANYKFAHYSLRIANS